MSKENLDRDVITIETDFDFWKDPNSVFQIFNSVEAKSREDDALLSQGRRLRTANWPNSLESLIKPKILANWSEDAS